MQAKLQMEDAAGECCGSLASEEEVGNYHGRGGATLVGGRGSVVIVGDLMAVMGRWLNAMQTR